MTATRRARDGFLTLVGLARGAMTKPGFELFSRLLVGWVLAPGRRTITSIYLLGDPEATCAHDAYHRFVRCGRLCLKSCWRALVVATVAKLCPDGPIDLDLDDTLHHRPGPKVEGAGVFRDAVRSTKRKVVYATGLNLVVVTLRVVRPGADARSGSRSGSPCTGRTPRRRPSSDANSSPTSQNGSPSGRSTSPVTAPTEPVRERPSPHERHLTVRRNASFDERVRRDGKRGRPRKRGRRLPTPSSTLPNSPTSSSRPSSSTAGERRSLVSCGQSPCSGTRSTR